MNLRRRLWVSAPVHFTPFMELLFEQDIHIFRSKETVWYHLVQLDQFGHFWFPYTSAFKKKTAGGYAENDLFEISHFSDSSLCVIDRLVNLQIFQISIVYRQLTLQLQYTLVEDGNATQLSVSCKMVKPLRFPILRYLIVIMLKKLFKDHLARFRQVVTKVEEPDEDLE